jgi:hypothetical protein
MDVFPKFIIETDDLLGDCIIIAKVTRHYQIVVNKDKVKGGGWFKMNKATNTITLHGESDQFGRATLEDITNCINKGNVFTTPSCIHSIAYSWNFDYDTGSEIIHIKSVEDEA